MQISRKLTISSVKYFFLSIEISCLNFWDELVDFHHCYICRCLPPTRTWHKNYDPKVGLKWGFRGGSKGRMPAYSLTVQQGPLLYNARTKTVWKPIEGTTYIYIYIYMAEISGKLDKSNTPLQFRRNILSVLVHWTSSDIDCFWGFRFMGEAGRK